jgi:hypothetical protein
MAHGSVPYTPAPHPPAPQTRAPQTRAPHPLDQPHVLDPGPAPHGARPPQPWSVLVLLCVAEFMVILDKSGTGFNERALPGIPAR